MNEDQKQKLSEILNSQIEQSKERTRLEYLANNAEKIFNEKFDSIIENTVYPEMNLFEQEIRKKNTVAIIDTDYDEYGAYFNLKRIDDDPKPFFIAFVKDINKKSVSVGVAFAFDQKDNKISTQQVQNLKLDELNSNAISDILINEYEKFLNNSHS